MLAVLNHMQIEVGMYVLIALHDADVAAHHTFEALLIGMQCLPESSHQHHHIRDKRHLPFMTSVIGFM